MFRSEIGPGSNRRPAGPKTQGTRSRRCSAARSDPDQTAGPPARKPKAQGPDDVPQLLRVQAVRGTAVRLTTVGNPPSWESVLLRVQAVRGTAVRLTTVGNPPSWESVLLRVQAVRRSARRAAGPAGLPGRHPDPPLTRPLRRSARRAAGPAGLPGRHPDPPLTRPLRRSARRAVAGHAAGLWLHSGVGRREGPIHDHQHHRGPRSWVVASLGGRPTRGPHTRSPTPSRATQLGEGTF